VRHISQKAEEEKGDMDFLKEAKRPLAAKFCREGAEKGVRSLPKSK